MAKARRVIPRSQDNRELWEAGGIAAYALAVELNCLLHRKGLIDDQEARDVFDNALANVENLSDQSKPVRMARNLLWSAIE